VSVIADLAAHVKFRMTTLQSPQTADVNVMNTESYASGVSFPVPWTSRVQTPVKRVLPGKMWSQPERFWPETYGGPVR
jgi:hypothetical protein